jgi:maleate isomerase
LPRVGVVVPPDNHVAEVEATTDLSGVCTVHVTRFPPVRDRPMRDRLAAYNRCVPGSADTLAGLAPVAVLVACTGSSYLLGPERDDALYQQVSADLGHEVRGACRCIRDRLATVGAGSITLVSPYEPWLTELSVRYWRASGIEVSEVHSVGGGRHPYAIGEDEISAALRDLEDSTKDVILVTGTGVATLQAVRRAQRRMSVSVLSSMLCGLDWLRSAALGAPTPSPGAAASTRPGHPPRARLHPDTANRADRQV